MCRAAVPGAPGAPAVSEIRATSCKLTWAPPERDGGAPITAYTVERSTGARWIQLKTRPTTCQLEVRLASAVSSFCVSCFVHY